MAYSTKYIALGGSDEHIRMGNVLSFERTDSFSLSLWIRASSTGYIITKREGAASYRGYGAYHNADNIEFFLCSTLSSSELNVTAPLYLNAGWNHLVWTYGGNSLPSGCNCYVNGSSRAITTVFNSLSGTIITTAEFNIGSRTNGVGCIAADMDEVAVYNKELSLSEAQWIYNTGLPRSLADPGCPSNVNAWWRMGEGDTFNTLLDSSGNGFHGTMQNMEITDIMMGGPSGVDGFVLPEGFYSDDSSVDKPGVLLGGTGPVGPVITTYYKMRAQDSGASPPGYVTWVVEGTPDFAGAGYSSASPTPVGTMVPGSAVVAHTWQEEA